LKIITPDRSLVRGSAFQLNSLREKFPRGLTFYKDYANIPNGTYAKATYQYLLNADFALGSPAATNTSTDGNFVIDGGYKATTANADVLKYLIAGNRTAAQETFIIKFSQTYNFNEVTVVLSRIIDTTSGKRVIYYGNAGDVGYYFQPKGDATAQLTTGNSYLANTNYVMAFTCQSTGNPNSELYINGTSITSDNTDFTGTFSTDTEFCLGNRPAGDRGNNITIKSVAFFNRVLSAGTVLALNNLM
jgi:hypothetical protein